MKFTEYKENDITKVFRVVALPELPFSGQNSGNPKTAEKTITQKRNVNYL
jgi:hypothetical protein